MSDDTPFYQVLYVSQLAPGVGVATVNEIVSRSRRDNPKLGITGVLLFDGERFGQLLEGNQADVDALMARIQRDPRHTDVCMLVSGMNAAPRCTSSWRSGYCEPQELEVFARDSTLRGKAALDAFMSVLLGADIE